MDKIKEIIDEIIENSERIKTLKEIIGVSLSDYDDLLVYKIDNLFKYAEALGGEVRETGYVSEDGFIGIAFSYRGYKFSNYISKEELTKIREKVLPPTTATEPNQNT